MSVLEMIFFKISTSICKCTPMNISLATSAVRELLIYLELNTATLAKEKQALVIRARHFSSWAQRFSGALRLLDLRTLAFTGLIKSDLSVIQQSYLVPDHPK
ncbi:hypothetical protein PHYBLDRAFT_71560 [Phycomyces blakesleeanus NRRL 1555(-)]|uniref:Uncharacterized protein n=1 Tax=Phycomyces blakesleeanus (strain ATCC 8743b / DSM 1359 / FGSC 10004 / NBRC 33097 / NRRL 1555) TaxID=763407 RepID=A0A162ZZX2_PHYB8|nr:hypothetical protein PHYBLDRAFT_171508 [Phycomyces blakesleeanus NRRL 1555(-)]XP_018291157.1 hypothetical protein PHYBLDRAFT_71560 [Phycomyces blakesleeanus NRRL 1555(-)]OAD70121.1 hypothetical protein PHYBLDRAFT_171508 [Phycomyces blakesleeanus NRRL 1555(-)]OAD73117.1 hypothetical protein PHYBLDRAFT_71560 [Phycomyces blakesleeanus NRRL 1555(-)]|eukprot:XP_018288161.1 hypothetical protein PHYBLDRAFT_171508 [Phycomyces blakesleeanus NRRL 1555(-)]